MGTGLTLMVGSCTLAYCAIWLVRPQAGSTLGFFLTPVPIDPDWEAICQRTFPSSYLFSSSISQVQGETQSVRTAKAETQVELLLPVTWPCSPALRLTAPVSPPAAFSQRLMGLL